MGGILWKETTFRYAHQRRYQLRSHENQLEIPEGIDCYSEYIETPNGHTLHTKCLIPRKEMIEGPDKKIKGMICYCLGYTSHVDWTMTLIGIEWCKKGYIFFMNDHYGHGSSQGLWTYITDFSVLVDDAYYAFEFGKRVYTPSIIKQKGSPFNYFILGASMGANIALQIVLKYQQKVKTYRASHWRRRSITKFEYDHDADQLHFEYDPEDYVEYLPPMVRYPYNGMMFISPMIKISEHSKPGALLTFILKNILLPFIPSAPIIPSKAKEMKYSTRDLKKMAEMERDPLQYVFNPRLATGWNLLSMCNYIEARLGSIRLPFMVLHGTGDKITDHSSSDILFAKAGTRPHHKKIKKYQDAYHHLLMEYCADQVYDDLDQWMDTHSRPGAVISLK